jgi:predicted nucleic acid-binding Zn ribbon protein
LSMTRTQPSQIKNIIKAAVEKAQAQKKTTGRTKRAWQIAAGRKAAKHSRPQRLTRKTLVVAVDSPVWIYYLHSHKQQIETALNNQLDARHHIKIRLCAGDYSDKTNNKPKHEK